MRIALISDIHGNLAALEAVAKDIRRRGVDQIVNLGDCISGPLLPLETAQYLMAEGWLCLAGNHERQMLSQGPQPKSASDAYALAQLTAKERAWLAALPATLRFSPEVFLCHGTPGSDAEYMLETVESGIARVATRSEIDARLGSEASPLVACGHTHVPRAVRSRRGQLIVNPGSVGRQAYDDTLPMPHAVETGSPDARYAIIEKQPAGWIASLLAVPYNHASMARLAKLRDRPEWEYALMTGYMP